MATPEYRTLASVVTIDELWFGGNRITPRFIGHGPTATNVGPVTIAVERLVASHDPTATYQGLAPRATRVSGIVVPSWVGPRGETPDAAAGYVADPGDHVDRGHMMALSNGGPDNELNVVPQWAYWQRHEEWRRMERAVYRTALEVWRATQWFVHYTVTITYVSFGPRVRPRVEVWGFARSYRITAYVTSDIQGTDNRGYLWLGDEQSGRVALHDYELIGYPDSWSAH